MSEHAVTVEVAFATPAEQVLEKIQLPTGSTVRDAINKSNLPARFPGFRLDALGVGIWGKTVARDQVLTEGDRVEVYRPLQADPREARREQAARGRTMADPATPIDQRFGSSS